ncbi:MAG: MipA/OmpV family protein [Pseudomonadota bacterium]
MKLLIKLLILLTFNHVMAADELPKLELGASLLAVSTPDYRGSESDTSHLIPFPYIKYRGERLRVDEGAQGIFKSTENMLITLSGNISLGVDDDIPEREGMNELDPILEIGPSVNFRLHQMQYSAWWLDLPLRFAFTLDSDIEAIGQIFQPRLSWRKPATRIGEWKLRFNIGPLYSSEKHHEYFYSVSAADATASRPAYNADGGFSGYRTEFTYSKRYGKLWLGGFVRYDSLQDSKIDDSPLVFEETAWVGGLALGWVFHER